MIYSMLRKYILDPSHVLEAPPVTLNEDMSLEIQLMGIIDKKLKN